VSGIAIFEWRERVRKRELMDRSDRCIGERYCAGRSGRSSRFTPVTRWRLAAIVCVALTWLGESSRAFAQNAQVAGYVRDIESRSVRDAEVLLVTHATGNHPTAKTNEVRLYVFGSVSPGNYRLVTAATGLQTTTTPSLVVEVGPSPDIVNQVAPSGAYVVNGQRAETSSSSVDGVSANVGVNADTALCSPLRFGDLGYAGSQPQWNTVASVSPMTAAHQVKGGVDYRLFDSVAIAWVLVESTILTCLWLLAIWLLHHVTYMAIASLPQERRVEAQIELFCIMTIAKWGGIASYALVTLRDVFTLGRHLLDVL
jgi:hypothetical protein